MDLGLYIVLRGIDLSKMNKKELKSFISYFFVGGSAALIEWISFFVVNLFFNYVISTIISFVLATYFNFFIGKKLTFKNFKNKKSDVVGVFIVSGIGLLFNILLMRLLVNKFKILPFISKVISTGVVFLWNYVSRRLLIYNNKRVEEKK